MVEPDGKEPVKGSDSTNPQGDDGLEEFTKKLAEVMPPELVEQLPAEVLARIRAGRQILIEMFEHQDPAALMSRPFQALDDIPSTHPRIQMLKEYGRELTDHMAVLRQPLGVSEGRAGELLAKLSDEEQKACLSKVVERLRGETDYLSGLDEGIAAALSIGLDKGKYRARVRFHDPESQKTRKAAEMNVGAVYFGLTNKVDVFDHPPTAAEMLEKLTTSGRLPRQVGALHHELVHSTQTSPSVRYQYWAKHGLHFGAVIGLNFVDPLLALSYVAVSTPFLLRRKNSNVENGILREAHAYEAMANSPSHYQSITEEPSMIVAAALSGVQERFFPVYFPVAARAFELVHGLRLVGLNDVEIGNLVEHANWDDEQRTFPRLEGRLGLELESMEIIAGQDKNTILNALHTRLQIELARQRKLACNIALEELERSAKTTALHSSIFQDRCRSDGD